MVYITFLLLLLRDLQSVAQEQGTLKLRLSGPVFLRAGKLQNHVSLQYPNFCINIPNLILCTAVRSLAML